MPPLIALVPTVVLVDGARIVIEPGQPLPKLAAHDARALLESRAAASPLNLDAQETQAALAVQAAGADFAAARQRAQDETASIAAPGPARKAGKTSPAEKQPKQE